MGAMQPDDGFVVILQRYTLLPIQVVPGATVIQAGCGHRAWISPQGVAFVREHLDATTSCSRCDPVDTSRDLYEVPGASQAAREMFGDAVVDRMKKKYNVKELPK